MVQHMTVCTAGKVRGVQIESKLAQHLRSLMQLTKHHNSAED